MTMGHYPDLGSVSDWLEICFIIQLEALPRSGKRRVISVQFLRSFLRRHFAGNQCWRREMSDVLSGYRAQSS